mmetsp:Transcript_190/g.877  ORF Transcript_190/g.877 Transcript_190/m.877 type:complete len:258 (+) Transcript_190:1746-2519(+)
MNPTTAGATSSLSMSSTSMSASFSSSSSSSLAASPMSLCVPAMDTSATFCSMAPTASTYSRTYSVSKVQICSLAVVNKNLNPFSVMPQPLSLEDRSAMSPAPRNRDATSSGACPFRLFAFGSCSSSRSRSNSSTFRPVKVSSSDSHLLLANSSIFFGVGRLPPILSEGDTVPSASSPSGLKHVSSCARIPFANLRFRRTSSLPSATYSWSPAGTNTRSRLSASMARPWRSLCSFPGRTHASISSRAMPTSTYISRIT